MNFGVDPPPPRLEKVHILIFFPAASLTFSCEYIVFRMVYPFKCIDCGEQIHSKRHRRDHAKACQQIPKVRAISYQQTPEKIAFFFFNFLK